MHNLLEILWEMISTTSQMSMKVLIKINYI